MSGDLKKLCVQLATLMLVAQGCEVFLPARGGEGQPCLLVSGAEPLCREHLRCDTSAGEPGICVRITDDDGGRDGDGGLDGDSSAGDGDFDGDGDDPGGADPGDDQWADEYCPPDEGTTDEEGEDPCRAAIEHGSELCGNGVDDDCDGSTDGADPSCRAQAPTTASINSVWLVDASDAWLGADDGLYHWTGQAWNEVGTGDNPSPIVKRVWAGGCPYRVAIINGNGSVWIREGDTWSKRFTQGGDTFDALWGSPEGAIFAGGPGGVFCKLDNGQAICNTVCGADIYDIHGRSADGVWAGANGKLCYLLEGSHTSSLVEENGQPLKVKAVYAAPDGTVWLGTGQGVYRRLLNGDIEKTTDQPAGNNAEVFDLWFYDSSGTVIEWAVAYDVSAGTNRLYDKPAATWTAVQTVNGQYLDGVVSVMGVPGQGAWVAGSGGVLFHYDGAYWRRFPN